MLIVLINHAVGVLQWCFTLGILVGCVAILRYVYRGITNQHEESEEVIEQFNTIKERAALKNVANSEAATKSTTGAHPWTIPRGATAPQAAIDSQYVRQRLENISSVLETIKRKTNNAPTHAGKK